MSNQKGIKIVFFNSSILLFSCKELTEQKKNEDLEKQRHYFSYSKKLIGDRYFSIYKSK
jgi:hypothetical protein